MKRITDYNLHSKKSKKPTGRLPTDHLYSVLLDQILRVAPNSATEHHLQSPQPPAPTTQFTSMWIPQTTPVLGPSPHLMLCPGPQVGLTAPVNPQTLPSRYPRRLPDAFSTCSVAPDPILRVAPTLQQIISLDLAFPQPLTLASIPLNTPAKQVNKTDDTQPTHSENPNSQLTKTNPESSTS